MRLRLELCVALLLVAGCYREHGGDSDYGAMPMAGGTAVNGSRSRDAGSNPAAPTGLLGAAADAGNPPAGISAAPQRPTPCEAPAQGCIAPGSPQSRCVGGVFIAYYGCALLDGPYCAYYPDACARALDLARSQQP